MYTCYICVSISSLLKWLAISGTFRSSLGMLLHDWRISILVVQTRGCPVSGLHWHRVGVIMFARRHPNF